MMCLESAERCAVTGEFKSDINEMWYTTEPERPWPSSLSVEELNSVMKFDFYEAISWLLGLGYEEYHELSSDTLSPATKNLFAPMREYRVKRNGHYKHIAVFARLLGGWAVSMRDWTRRY